MPTNVTPQYIKAEQEYHQAKTISQKLAALKKMLATVPKHKGTEKLQKRIKEQIRKIKYKKEKESKQKRSGHSLAIKKEGAAQIVFVGLPNSGKSTLLAKLSGKPVKIADYPFTTKEPEVRMIPFENIKIQGIEIPAIYEGFSETPKGRQFLSIIRNSDLIVLVIKNPEDKKLLVAELENANIKPGKKRFFEDFVQHVPFLIIKQSEFNNPTLKQKIWAKLNKIRVQTRTKGKAADKPVILKQGATVKDVAKIVHKDFVKKFKYAKIWGPSAKFNGQQVGLEHKLTDGDTIEIYTK